MSDIDADEIMIVCREGVEHRAPGLRIGLFAVHRRICDCLGRGSDEYRVSHLPTGARLNNLRRDLSREECIGIAEQLSAMRGWDFTVEWEPGVHSAKPFDRREWAAEAVEAAQARVLFESRGIAA